MFALILEHNKTHQIIKIIAPFRTEGDAENYYQDNFKHDKQIARSTFPFEFQKHWQSAYTYGYKNGYDDCELDFLGSIDEE